ncbi:MAG: O-acetyl-ADP-ribose deacetylase [Acidobacteria bacterium]|nr:MAG: O-acetyl-ADP-ribose deacetylase [Acidobacteriota bacterium]
MIEIVRADITTLDVDAIVNAANERMLGGGGVDGAIHRAAGRELYDACLAVPEVRPGVRCPTGQSRITPGFNLPARYVIHTVGPIWGGGQDGEPGLLASCYRTALELARQHRAAAAIAVRETRARQTEFDQIVLVAFDGEVHRALNRSIRSDRSGRSRSSERSNGGNEEIENDSNVPNGSND